MTTATLSGARITLDARGNYSVSKEQRLMRDRMVQHILDNCEQEA